MRVDVSQTLFKFSIPVSQEVSDKELGEFIKAERRGYEIVVYYQRTPDPPSSAETAPPFVVDFNK
jgi:hypothetical protein